MSKKESTQINFEWHGTNKRGLAVTGEMAAVNTALLKAELRRQGITPTKVRKKSASFFAKSKAKIEQQDITIFLRQLSTMINAGVPLAQAFDIIGKGNDNPKLAEMILALKNDLEAGNTLADVFRKQPKHFNDFICNLVDAGEQSGSLDTMIDRIALYKEKVETIRKKVKKALFYPIVVLCVALGVTVGLLIFVVPQFAKIFESFGAELPAMTQVVMALSTFMQAWWYIIIGGGGFAIWSFAKAVKRSPRLSFWVDQKILQLPIIGGILRKAAISRFCRTLATTFASGLPLVDCLTCVSGATGNQLYGRAAIQIREDVATGQQLNLSMRISQVFPNMVIQMVAIGEEAGSLETMLNKVSDFYEEDVDNAVDNLSSLLEPLIMVILGVLVGGLLVAMYMPIFQLGSVI